MKQKERMTKMEDLGDTASDRLLGELQNQTKDILNKMLSRSKTNTRRVNVNDTPLAVNAAGESTESVIYEQFEVDNLGAYEFLTKVLVDENIAFASEWSEDRNFGTFTLTSDDLAKATSTLENTIRKIEDGTLDPAQAKSISKAVEKMRASQIPPESAIKIKESKSKKAKRKLSPATSKENAARSAAARNKASKISPPEVKLTR